MLVLLSRDMNTTDLLSLPPYSLNSTKYAIPKKIMKKLVLASVVTTQCLELCLKADLAGVRNREEGRSLSDYLFV